MTKKHFRALATALASVRPERDPSSRGDAEERFVEAGRFDKWEQCVSAVADVCASQNPRFRRSTFVEACETWTVAIRGGVLVPIKK